MLNLDEHNITDEVIRRWDDCADPRFRQIMASLIRHLHDFAREVKLTEPEWKAGVEFLTAVGHKCDGLRQEFILLSDTLGLSQLVVAQIARSAGGPNMVRQIEVGVEPLERAPSASTEWRIRRITSAARWPPSAPAGLRALPLSPANRLSSPCMRRSPPRRGIS